MAVVAFSDAKWFRIPPQKMFNRAFSPIYKIGGKPN
jgi:hypothetical protein